HMYAFLPFPQMITLSVILSHAPGPVIGNRQDAKSAKKDTMRMRETVSSLSSLALLALLAVSHCIGCLLAQFGSRNGALQWAKRVAIWRFALTLESRETYDAAWNGFTEGEGVAAMRIEMLCSLAWLGIWCVLFLIPRISCPFGLG